MYVDRTTRYRCKSFVWNFLTYHNGFSDGRSIRASMCRNKFSYNLSMTSTRMLDHCEAKYSSLKHDVWVLEKCYPLLFSFIDLFKTSDAACGAAGAAQPPLTPAPSRSILLHVLYQPRRQRGVGGSGPEMGGRRRADGKRRGAGSRTNGDWAR